MLPDNVRYASTESAVCFSFSNFIKKVKEEVRRNFPDCSGDEYRKLVHKSLKNFTINDQTFDYTTNPNHLGGVRWFVKCPDCGRPCLKLYLPNKHKNREQRYLCQHCHKLKNSCLLLGSTTRYKKIFKPLKRMEKLKRKLLKKNISTEDAVPLLDEYQQIERELQNSPDYRLWKFQREHLVDKRDLKEDPHQS